MAEPTAIYSRAVRPLSAKVSEVATGPLPHEPRTYRVRLRHDATGGSSVFVATDPGQLGATTGGGSIQSGWTIGAGVTEEFWLQPGQKLYGTTDSANPVIVSVQVIDDTSYIEGWPDLMDGLRSLWGRMTGQRRAA